MKKKERHLRKMIETDRHIKEKETQRQRYREREDETFLPLASASVG